MKKTFYIPSRVHCTFGPNAEEDNRLQATILSSIGTAIDGILNKAAESAVADHDARDRTSERFSADRYNAGSGSYRIPSYQEGGAPTEVPVEEVTFTEEEAETVTSFMRLHPAGEVSEDRVLSGRSPFEGQLVAILPRWETVRIHSERYAVASDLNRAVTWGKYLFGARAFVILEGPFGQPGSRYYALGTTHALGWSPPASGASTFIGETEVWGISARHWESEFQDVERRSYLLRALVTVDGNTLFPPNPRLVEEFLHEQAIAPRERGEIPAEMARRLVYEEIDRLIAAGDTEAAAQRLAELDVNAFTLVGWETKARYMQVLIEAWTREPQEVAIIEIIKSIDHRTELFAALGAIRNAGLYHQLFDDLDSQIWSLLVVVGERFGEPGSMTFSNLVDLLQQAGIMPRNLRDLATRITLGPAGPILSLDLLAETEEAARGFVRFLGGALEAAWMLISEPEKVVEGITQLVKLATMVQLAQIGYPPAVEYVGNILVHMAQTVVHGLKGARLFGITGAILRRIKWAIIWEVASWFIGLGEVKAILSGAGLTERVAEIARLLRLLGLFGRGIEAERAASKVEHLVRLASRISSITEEENLIRLLRHLPEEDLARLGRLLRSADVQGAHTFAELAIRYPELGEAARHAVGRVEALAVLEQKTGRLTETLADGFRSLATRSGFTNQELLHLMSSVPADNVELFMRAVRTLPDEALGRGVGGRSLGFFQELSERPRSMQFLVDAGYDNFAAFHRYSHNDFVRFEENLEALSDLARRLPGGQHEVEYQRFLDRLRSGDPAAYRELEDARAARRAAEGLPGRQPQAPGASIAGIEPRLRERGYRPEAIEALTQAGIDARRGTRLYRQLLSAGANTREFINAFYRRPGFDQMVLKWAEGGSSQEGARFIMRYCLRKLKDTPIRFEWPVGIRHTATGGETWARYVDIVIDGGTNVNPGSTIYMEFKSWTSRTLSRSPGRLKFQLVRDRALFDPRDVRWVFDSQKISRQEVLDAFTNIIKKDPYLAQVWGGTEPELVQSLSLLLDIF